MKKKKPPIIVTIMALSVVTVVVWIVFGVIRLIKTPTVLKDVPEEIVSPLTPTLDIETLRSLENSLFFTDSQIGAGNVSNIDLFPTQEPETVEEIVEEATEEESVESTSTESGGLVE